jgi:hypothetical protein
MQPSRSIAEREFGVDPKPHRLARLSSPMAGAQSGPGTAAENAP